MKRLFTSSIVLSLLAITANAETIERPWKANKGSTSTHGRTIFGKQIVKDPNQPEPAPVRRTFNTPKSNNPSAPKAATPIAKTVKSDAAVNKGTGKAKRKTTRKSNGLKRPIKRTVKRRSRSTKETKWWAKTGNPVVFAFRDCSEKFALTQVRLGKIDSASNLITASMKSDCQIEFTKMAGVLIGGLGQGKSNAILKELAQTTFLPTVRQAIATVEKEKSQVAQAKAAAAARTAGLAKASSSRAVQTSASTTTSKAAMFKCFVERTDHLSAARSTQANTIASAVLAGCSPQADVFFAHLFANSKASQAVKKQQQAIALDEVYRQAIIKRVLVTRGRAKVQTATGTPPK